MKLSQEDGPLVIVGCGNDGSLKDVSVKAVKAPVSVRADQPYDVIARIAGRGLGDQPVEVELWTNNVLTDRKSVVVSHADRPQDVVFSIYAPAPGTDELKVVARAVDGESNVSNNIRRRLVEVQSEAGLSVLLYSQVASFDIGRVRQSLARDPRIQLDFVFDAFIDPKLKPAEADRPARFPESGGEMNRYDLIVLGPCRFDRFSDGQIHGLYDFVCKRGGSVVFLPGREGFGPADCDIQDIRTLVPVDFDNPGVPADAKGLSLTEEGLDQCYAESFCDVERTDDIETAYASLAKKPAASTVVECRQLPLVCTQRLGRGKTAIINSRNLYQLYREDQADGPLLTLIRDVYLGQKSIAVELDEVRREMDDVRCDKAFLKSLCQYVGAEYVDIDDLTPETFDRFKPYHMAQQDRRLERIWPRWVVFGFLVFALILQWCLRRAKGLIWQMAVWT